MCHTVGTTRLAVTVWTSLLPRTGEEASRAHMGARGGREGRTARRLSGTRAGPRVRALLESRFDRPHGVEVEHDDRRRIGLRWDRRPCKGPGRRMAELYRTRRHDRASNAPNLMVPSARVRPQPGPERVRPRLMDWSTVFAGVLHEALGRGVEGQPVGVRREYAHRPARAGGAARPIRRSQRMLAQRAPRRAPAVADHRSPASNVERPAAARSPSCSWDSPRHGRRKIGLSRRLSSRSRRCSVPQYEEFIADPLVEEVAAGALSMSSPTPGAGVCRSHSDTFRRIRLRPLLAFRVA